MPSHARLSKGDCYTIVIQMPRTSFATADPVTVNEVLETAVQNELPLPLLVEGHTYEPERLVVTRYWWHANELHIECRPFFE